MAFEASHTCRVDQILEPLGLVLAKLNVNVVVFQWKVDLWRGKTWRERGRQMEMARRLNARGSKKAAMLITVCGGPFQSL